jgi:hypothetical protein
MSIATRIRISPWLPVTGMLAALVFIVLLSFGPAHSPRIAARVAPAFKQLVHWHDAGHDWLLIADGRSDQLSVYSTSDGRLLRQLSVKHGLNDVNALAQRDGRLFVIGDDGQRGELKLPQLQMVASNAP